MTEIDDEPYGQDYDAILASWKQLFTALKSAKTQEDQLKAYRLLVDELDVIHRDMRTRILRDADLSRVADKDEELESICTDIENEFSRLARDEIFDSDPVAEEIWLETHLKQVMAAVDKAADESLAAQAQTAEWLGKLGGHGKSEGRE